MFKLSELLSEWAVSQLMLFVNKLLIIDIYPDHCIAILISENIIRVRFTLYSEASFGSVLYEHHVVSAAFEILGIIYVDFAVFLNYV